MKIRKEGSGRKKGSVCFTIVTLAELNRLLKPDAEVTVGKKFAESINLIRREVKAQDLQESQVKNNENNLDKEEEIIVKITKEW